MSLGGLRVLLFDTFGTIVDWRGSIARAMARIAAGKGIEGIDWDAFARAWRAGYRPALEDVINGRRPWTPLDALHRERLEEILTSFDLEAYFSDSERHELSRLWHRLDPWPDAVPGLLRLRTRYLIGPLSNGGTVLLATMARRAGIPWDLILSSDILRAYKRDPRAYLGAIAALDLQPGEVMMCAAHNDDLEAAATHGMRTAYINRPHEYGPDQSKDFAATGPWDVVTDSVEGLAEALGVPEIGEAG